jgi:gas vesicle protein
LIGAYASIFELSVALNFAYASSKQFRETMKTGFLSNINKMDTKYKYYQEKLDNDLNMIDEILISIERKTKLKTKYKKILDDIHNEGSKLEEKLNKAQDTISRKIKPIYTFVAMISLFILFLGGQEVKHELFPLETMNTIVLLSSLSIVVFYLLSFTKYELTIVNISFILIISIVPSIFTPSLFPQLLAMINIEIFKKEYIINIALVVAFSPFIISLLTLSFSTLKLEINHRQKYRSVMKEVAKLNSNIEVMSESKNFINNL